MKRLLVLALALTGCMAGELFRPLPHYVWGCLHWSTVTVRNGDGVVVYSARTCTQEGWLPAVDTVPAADPVPK